MAYTTQITFLVLHYSSVESFSRRKIIELSSHHTAELKISHRDLAETHTFNYEE